MNRVAIDRTCIDTITKSTLTGRGDFLPEGQGGHNLHFGVREHAMGAIVGGGLDLHGGVIPYSATFLMRRFGLEESARSRMRGLDVDTPWEAFAALRAPIYAKMLEDPEVLRKEQRPRNVALLEEARRTGEIAVIFKPVAHSIFLAEFRLPDRLRGGASGGL